MQQKMRRRTFIRGAGLVAGTAFAATITQISALAGAANAGRRPMSYDIKSLPFARGHQAPSATGSIKLGCSGSGDAAGSRRRA
jgi:hypothetical protein